MQDLHLIRVLAHLGDVLFHVRVFQRRHVQEPRPAVHTDHRDRPRLQVHIQPADLDGGLQEIVQRQATLFHMDLRLRRMVGRKLGIRALCGAAGDAGHG